MIQRSTENLAGKSVNQNRAQTWHLPSATSCVPLDNLKEFVEVKERPEFGDLVLCEVEQMGEPDFIEDRHGCNLQIFDGTILLGVISTRYAPDAFEGVVPERLVPGQELSLLNRGGAIGSVLSKNSFITEPTKLKVLAFIKDQEGRIANTRHYARQVSDDPALFENSDRKLILIVGTSMNSGKTNAAKALVYSLSAAGHNVVAGKATGCAAKKDSFLMRAAGARCVTDFIDYGIPSTYLLPRAEVKSLFWQVYNYLHENSKPGDYIIIELADGIIQKETAMLLADRKLRSRIHRLMFACGDPLSGLAGVRMLRERFGLETHLIGGRIANSEIGIRELHRVLGDVPVVNTLRVDIESVLDLVR